MISDELKAALSVPSQISLDMRELRQAKGMTQKELAQKLNTSHATIARWERIQYRGYTLSSLIEIARALDCTLSVQFTPSKGGEP